MAIKKDIDDMLDNLNGKNSENATPNKKITGSAPKKLAPLPPKKTVSDRKPVSSENKSKKRIVISSELPDYDALRAQERERERLEAERKAKEEAERKAKEEAERKAKEEAERIAKEEAERIAKEEAERIAKEEAERKAKEEAERKAKEEAERKAKEEEKKRLKEERKRRKAEKKAKAEERKRLEAEKKAEEDDENFSIEEVTDDNEKNESDPVSSLIDNIREDAEKAVADIENGDVDSQEETDEEETETVDTTTTDDEDLEAVSFGISPVLEKILDEDPDEIINERSEKTEDDDESDSDSKFKRNFYAVFGVIFAVFACVGFITVVSKGISMVGGYTSGDNKKNGFESVVYPVVIMDIDSFNNPTELPSDQIITAAIWSMIMSDDAVNNYEMTFDVVKIPAVDVESYAVKLFGENLPALNHTTVGPVETRFYYNEETKSYNVPIAPVTYTYSPEIKGATKSGDNYTIVVDYIDELPEWLPKASSKSVEFKLTETNDGYTINSMKILSTTNNSL